LTSTLTPTNGGATLVGNSVTVSLPIVNTDAPTAGVTQYNYPIGISVDKFGRVTAATSLSPLPGTQFQPVSIISAFTTSGVTLTAALPTAQLIPGGLTLHTLGAGNLIVSITTSIKPGQNTNTFNIYTQVGGITGLIWNYHPPGTNIFNLTTINTIHSIPSGGTYNINVLMTGVGLAMGQPTSINQSSAIVTYNLAG
jgi:hypothetical protein